MLAFSRETGGFTLLSIEHSTADAVGFKVMGRSDHLTAYGSLRLASAAPPKVRSLNIRALPPGAKVDDTPLDGAARRRTLDAVSKQLTEFYVYPDVGKQMIDAVEDTPSAAIRTRSPTATSSPQDLRTICGR